MKQTLKYIYTNIQEQLKFSEQKHSIIIAINSGIIVLVTGLFKETNTVLLIINWLIYIFCSASILCNFFALYSKSVKVSKRECNINRNINLLYYKEILNMTEIQYLDLIRQKYGYPNSYKFDELEKDLAKQIIANSIVVERKYKLFNLSILFLTLGLIFAIVFLLGVSYYA